MSKKPSQKRSIAPAEGERRAIRSLAAQYRVAAQLIRDALCDGELEWVRLVDPEAGRLDDVVIGRPGRVDAYQIKWSDYRGQVTFHQLVTGSKVAGKPYPAPFKLLADGWRQLATAYPDRIVRAHFLTHDAPSSTDGKIGEGNGEPPHLQGFLRNAWPSRGEWHADGNAAFRGTWLAKIDKIAEATDFKGPELDQLLSHCVLDLGFTLADDPESGRDQEARGVGELAQYLMNQVAKGSGALHISRADLLRGLGWTDRFELSFKHDFPVDERLYRPVEETVQAISRALSENDRGYVALIGPPGSGKSTALTHTLRYTAGIRLVRYYAFVRDDPRLGRGEAAAFLHDLCLSLEPLAPRAKRQRGGGDDPESLRERIAALLAELSTEWKTSGVKTVILIDGLDHIAREQSPVRNLIHELPHPSSIPEGVLIVLGTQQVGLEGDAASLRPITAQLEQQARKLEMARLSRASIRSIVETAVDPSLLGEDAHERIARLSAGHPLALAYLVKRLAAAASVDEASAIIDASVSYDGEIEAEYRTYWATLRDEPEVRGLLGLVCRLRGAVDLSTVEALGSPVALERFAVTARHYFQQDTANTWRFFHNSFRLFVLDMTARNAFDRPDPAVAAGYHRRLAEAGTIAPPNGQLAWERLHHVEKAGDAELLVALNHQPMFRLHFLAGRPDWEIEEDIGRCMRAAAAVGDAMAVLGLLLAHKELEDRTSALETVDLSTIELKLRTPEDRIGALISGGELLIPDAVALKWSARLVAAGEAALASRVFELAEPLDLLSGTKSLDATRRDEDLDAWARSSWRFRPLETVVAAARQVRVDVRMTDMAPPYEATNDATLEARGHLLETVALALLKAGETQLLAELEALVETAPEGANIGLRLDVARVHAATDGSGSMADGEAALQRIIAAVPPDDIEPTDAARIADLICRLGSSAERADEYLAKAEAPILPTQLDARDDTPFASVETLFRQARARAARGRPFDAAVDVPNPASASEAGRTLFCRAVVLVANLWGEALQGTTVPASEVVRRLGPVIRLYRRAFGETNRWLDWHYAQRASGRLFELMLRAAQAHGSAAFAATLDATMRDWQRRERGLTGWTLDSRRSVALAAFRIDGDAARTAEVLTELDAEVDIDYDLHDRIEQWRASIDASLTIGRRDEALKCRDKMLATSFGVYIDRDEQVADWAKIGAAAIDLAEDADIAEDATRTLVTILRVLHRTHRGGVRDDAVLITLAATARREVAAALQQGDWLLAEAGATRPDVLAAIAIGLLASSDANVVAGALTFATRLILPFSLHSPDGLAQAATVVASGPLASQPSVASALETMRHIARTKVQHRRAFDELTGVERAPVTIRATERSRPGTLVRADGSTLSQAQVEDLASDPGALAAALARATDTGLSWNAILERLPGVIGGAALRAIGRWLIAAGVGSGTLLPIVHRAHDAGDAVLAEEATNAALAGSKGSGWLARYDGGSRLLAAECLVLSDPVNGRRRALELLVADHLARPLPVRDLISDLTRILSLVSERQDAVAVWSELRKHLGALAEVAENPAQAPPFEVGSAVAAEEVPAVLLLRHIDDPSNAVALEARKGSLAMIDAGDPGGHIRQGIIAALAGDVNMRSAALATISALAWSAPEKAAGFAEAVRPMAWDEHGVLRRLAQQILIDLNEEMPDAPPQRELPPVYRLQLPDTPMAELNLRGSELPRGEPLPDTEDSVDLSRLFHPAFRRIEKLTGIPFSTLARRFARIMRSIAPPETWSAAAERQLMNHLEATGMKISIRRPRSLVSHQTFGVLLAELCDAQVLEWPADEFDEMLLNTDSMIDARDPDPRPDWLAVPSGKEIGDYPREDWLAGVSDALPSLRATPDGRIVIAEWTRAVSIDSDREEECRASIVAHRQLTLADRMPTFDQLWRESDYIGREYPMLFGGRPDWPVAAIAGGPLFSDADFLALNPRIGFTLGWRFSDEGLFRWIDDTGAVMAESLWWQDGNLAVNDHSGLDEAAYEGWLVLVSPEGWERMRPLLRHCDIQRAAGRSIPDRDADDGERESSAIDSLPLPA